jgi:hypothetical protein
VWTAHILAPIFSRPYSRAHILAPIFSRLYSRAYILAPIFSRLYSRAYILAPIFSRLIATLTFLLFAATLCPADPSFDSSLTWDPAQQGAFVTSLCRDTRGWIWVGTEGKGVWRYLPQMPFGMRWAQFTPGGPNGGPGDDDIYALACDRLGRVWAGTVRDGVAVYDGRSWKTYGPAEGLSGSRVFAIAACPTDGDVWIATEGGLTRYSLSHHVWRTYSRLDGLPSDAISSLAFAADGTLYVGTQADGIAIAHPGDDYAHWRIVTAPDTMPNVPDGVGLPSPLINCLLVGHDGTVWAGTDRGLARSRDGGLHWRFLRGKDWHSLVGSLAHGSKPEETWDPNDRLGEDYVTALAEDAAHHLYVGHRRTGLDCFDERTGFNWPPGQAKVIVSMTEYVSCLLAEPNGALLAGCHGGGLASLGDAADAPPAAAPGLAELNALLRAASAVRPDPRELTPKAIALDDDWCTEGDWLGRHGRYWFSFPALFHPIPLDYLWGAGWQPVDYKLQMGPHHLPGDSLRYWLNSRYTTEPHCLEMPPTYLHSRVLNGYTTWAVNRRDTSVDDHGEETPITMDGPGIFATVSVPPGLYVLSLYYFLRQDNATGDRDFRLSVRPHVGFGLDDLSQFQKQPEWARGRVYQDFGGVWKRFLVRGPVDVTVQTARNNSWNTELDGVALDLADEMPPPYFGTPPQWQEAQAADSRLRHALLTRCGPAPRFHSATSEAEAANRLFAALATAQSLNSHWWAISASRFYGPLLRWYAAQAALPTAKSDTLLWRRLASCNYQMGLYPAWESCLRLAGIRPARDTELALRWNQITPSNSGNEYAVLTQFLATQKPPEGKDQGKEEEPKTQLVQAP